MAQDYARTLINLATARPIGQPERFFITAARLYALTVDAPFTLRIGSPSADPIPVERPGRLCYTSGAPVGEVYIENDAAGGAVAVLIASDALDLDFFGSAAPAAAATIYEQVFPTSAGGGTPQLDRQQSSRDVWTIDSASSGTITIVNDAVRQLRAWQINIPAGGGVGRHHIRRNRRLLNLLQIVGDGSPVAPFRPDLGMSFIETDVLFTNVVTTGQPQWFGVLLSFDNANLRPIGLVYSPADLGPNWRLVLAEQAFSAGFTGIALNLDTGIPANVADVQRRIRVEAGTLAGVPTLRALIDGAIVAVQSGPVGVLTAGQIAASVLEPSVGLWSNGTPATTDTITVQVGGAIGIRAGHVAA